MMSCENRNPEKKAKGVATNIRVITCVGIFTSNMAHLLLLVMLQILSYLTAPSLWSAVFITQSSFLLIITLTTTLLYANVAAHTTNSDEHIITVQLLYWWISWTWLAVLSTENLTMSTCQPSPRIHQ
jgi:hypothetical protein